MYQDVRQNFEEKVSYIARTVTGMAVNDQSSFLSVDCGLPGDTFNVLVVRDMSAPVQMLENIDRFTSKGFPLAVWFWESDVDQLAHQRCFNMDCNMPRSILLRM